MTKHILVLARRDVREAMRVAAGLTIRNNTVDFVFMTAPPVNAHGKIDHMEFLELAEIAPQSLVEIAGDQNVTPCEDLSKLINHADRVVSF